MLPERFLLWPWEELTLTEKEVIIMEKNHEKRSYMLVSIQEFKSHLSSYVHQARSGQLIELTSHRRVVARIIGVSSGESEGIARLVEQGVASWQGGKPSGADIRLSECGKAVSTLVLEDRG